MAVVWSLVRQLHSGSKYKVWWKYGTVWN